MAFTGSFTRRTVVAGIGHPHLGLLERPPDRLAALGQFLDPVGTSCSHADTQGITLCDRRHSLCEPCCLGQQVFDDIAERHDVGDRAGSLPGS